MSHHLNIVRLKAVNNALADLQEKAVFVGGATISLYPDRPVLEVRPTNDVDVIIELIKYFGRAELEEKLRTLGFSHDIESGVICRYRVQGFIVDIMPTDDQSIGFHNKWYPEGFKKAVNHDIDDHTTVKILSAPYFVATKMEAFKSRGNADGRTSHDFEDIVYVLENRKAIWQELSNTDEDLKVYLKAEFLQLLNNPAIIEWIECHVEKGLPAATPIIMKKLQDFTRL